MMPSGMLVGQRFGDVSRQTMRVIDIIASWVVNTFYNYLHEEAVALHTKGRVGSITDGYRYIVKQYLESFNSVEGYKRLVVSLHKYYVDNSHCAAIAFDEWTREVLEQFVPIDYKSIMSNEQQDILLRNILINAIEQFSSEVICTKLLDLLISNHDEPSIAPQMKTAMKSVLLAERQKIFNNIHKASTGSEPGTQMTIKREICALIEENIILKSKNGKLTETVKKSLEGMKIRDKAISVLKMQLADGQKQIDELQRQLHIIGQPQLVVQPRTQADDFKFTLATISNTGAAAQSHMQFPPMNAGRMADNRSKSGPSREFGEPQQTRAVQLPGFMTGKKDTPESMQGRYADTSRSAHQLSLPSQEIVNIRSTRADVAAPLSHLEKSPEPFEQADPEPESEITNGDSAVEELVRPTGNDTISLSMDEFMNG